MSAAAALMLMVPFWPGTLALVVLALRRWRTGAALALAGPLPALWVAMRPPLGVDYEYPWILLGGTLGIDAAGHVFLLFTAAVWVLAGVYACASLPGGPRREGFFACFLLAMSGNLGALVALDMPSFYALFALMSFAAYGLVAYHLTPAARRAARVYIVLVVAGEAAIAIAMLSAAGALGTDEFAAVRAGFAGLPDRNLIVTLAFIGFGIKAGVLFLHVWLPLAHPVAPAAASAVLSGTIIATGLVGWLKFLPVGELALPAWGGACIVVGLAAAFYAAAVGSDQHEPKVVLAYSSVSQMGIMTAGVGIVLLAPDLAATMLPAIAFFAMHHGLAKCALFLGAGLGAGRLVARQRRLLVTGLALPSLALAGAPLTSGMLAKSALLSGKTAPSEPWLEALQLLLPLTSVATALLMARFLLLVSRQRGHAGHQARPAARAAWLAAVLLAAILPWLFAPEAAVALTPGHFVASLWPLLTAALAAGVAVRLWRRAGRPPIPEIPAGDLLLPIEKVTDRLVRGLHHAAAAADRLAAVLDAGGRALLVRAWSVLEATDAAEAALIRWSLALLLALLVGLVMALVGARP